jgi:putative nucleotidyltransferase with HDIG domain
MPAHFLTQDEVIEHSKMLPGFPRTIGKILATIEDPESNLLVLVEHIEQDPVITARVLSLASLASSHTQRQSAVRDIFTATTIIGMKRVRKIAVLSSISGFVGDAVPPEMSASFWQHSIAVGVCSEELALHTESTGSVVTALIAGLLHDIGQLWLHSYDALGIREAWNKALSRSTSIEETEREHFGVDHSTIGAWLAEHWALPTSISAAIRYHHAPDAGLAEPLVPLVHIAEVLSNALDITGRAENRVTSISGAACRRLGLLWDEDSHALFGRMEARSRHANSLFNKD